MALLKFICKDCGQVFEELIFSSAERDKIVCPHCGSQNTCRNYTGKCYFGTPGGSGAGSCSGNCSCCSGCK